jgi:hypothetical protein
MQRQAATANGLQRRIRDLDFAQVADPREARKVKLRLPALLCALVTAMVTKARSLRAVEQRTAQLTRKLVSWLGIIGRVADNTFSKLLPRLPLADLVACLQRLVKAEHRRGNLKPTRLAVGAIAIDGKNTATLHWHDLCRVLDLEPADATPAQLKEQLAARYPAAQFCQPQEGPPYALLRVHTVTLISADAAPCIHLRPIEGATNEAGAMPALLAEVAAAYQRSGLFHLVTTDAGNTARELMGQVVEDYHWHYCAQIKSEHGDLYAEAERVLRPRRRARAAASYSDCENGQQVTYHLWGYDLEGAGWLAWTHARQLLRVERVAQASPTAERTVGNRYYVVSLAPDDCGPKAALSTTRAHWRCELETHWTADAELGDDRRRLAWSRHPDGVLAVEALRMMALAILAVARRLSRLGYTRETPTWHQVAEHFLLELCGSILETAAFDHA